LSDSMPKRLLLVIKHRGRWLNTSLIVRMLKTQKIYENLVQNVIFYRNICISDTRQFFLQL
jgi:hypothetical protein